MLFLSKFTAGCLILAIAPGPVALPARHKVSPALNPDEAVAHVLNRLTFGPRPGDLERVKAVGIKRWIDQQLEPERIDDSLLEARLQAYPAMRLGQPALLQQFPSPAVIRAVADQRLPLPAEPMQRAIYQNQVFQYQEKQKKEAQEAAAAKPANENLVADAMALDDVANSPSITVHEQKLYEDLASTQVVNLPPNQRIEKLVNMRPGQLRDFLKSLTPEEHVELTNGLTPQQKETVVALINPAALVTGELLQTRLLTDLYSQRQLQAVMTDFWLNHFNVFLKKGPFAPWYLVDYERNVIAPRAMGKFEDLLVATAQSPAMLFYLDNHASIGPHSLAAQRAQMNRNAKNRDPGLNENYARELMELHTLGVDGGYTQTDVTEVAKVFTGWTIDDPRKGASFVFNERRHEPGPKRVLGQTIQPGGEQEGLQVLHMLAMNPATARHISQQLAERFVSDDPPPALVDRMTRAYMHTGGDIREVLRAMLSSNEFWSRSTYRAKVKTPEEFVISAVRATGGQVETPALVLNAMSQLGMPFFGCQTPNGYSWKAEAWINSADLVSGINIALELAGHKLGTVTDLDALMRVPGTAPAAEKEAKLEGIILSGALSPQERQTILQQAEQLFAQGPPAQDQSKPDGKPVRAAFVQVMDTATPVLPPADKQAAVVAGLLLGSPGFQRR